MAKRMKINIDIKNVGKSVADIDREIRLILRNNLEEAIFDTCNGLICDYRYEGEFVKLQIKRT